MGYSFRLAPRVLLCAPSQRQDSIYHGLWYTSRGALAGTRNSSMGPHEDDDDGHDDDDDDVEDYTHSELKYFFLS